MEVYKLQQKIFSFIKILFISNRYSTQSINCTQPYILAPSRYTKGWANGQRNQDQVLADRVYTEQASTEV